MGIRRGDGYDDDDGSPVRMREYCGLLRSNKRFRYLFLSYLLTRTGKWVNYIASLALIHRLLACSPATMGPSHCDDRPDESSSGSLGDNLGNMGQLSTRLTTDGQSTQTLAMFVAGFMFLRMMPALVLAPVIGIVADRCDKRLAMVCCDALAGACAVLLTVFSIVMDSGAHGLDDSSSRYWVWPVFFLLTFGQQSCSAQYTSLRKSLVPFVCLGPRELKLATTVDASTWSAVMSFGGALGGLLTTARGISANFAFDSLSYAMGAVLMLLMDPVAKANSHRSGGHDPGSIRRAGRLLQRPHYRTSAGASLCDHCCFADTLRRLKVAEEEEERSATPLAPLWPYLWARPGLIVVLFAKMSGALTWGIAELLEVQMANDTAFQLAGLDASATLGVVYAAGGFGALLGPLVANSFQTRAGGSEARSSFTMVVGFAVGVVAYAVLSLAALEGGEGQEGGAGAAAAAATSAPAHLGNVGGPFSSWSRFILTEIYLCHACSDHEIEDGNGAPGRPRGLVGGVGVLACDLIVLDLGVLDAGCADQDTGPSERQPVDEPDLWPRVCARDVHLHRGQARVAGAGRRRDGPARVRAWLCLQDVAGDEHQHDCLLVGRVPADLSAQAPRNHAKCHPRLAGVTAVNPKAYAAVW
eukprot:COSAG01_NODE_5269_length_4369_cov_15.316159_2_plen_641_part_00